MQCQELNTGQLCALLVARALWPQGFITHRARLIALKHIYSIHWASPTSTPLTSFYSWSSGRYDPEFAL